MTSKMIKYSKKKVKNCLSPEPYNERKNYSKKMKVNCFIIKNLLFPVFVFLLFISNIYFDVFDVCNVCKACNGKDFRRTRHLACGVRRVCHLFISKYL